MVGSSVIAVDLLVLDGASAGAVGATVDILSAANRIAGEHRFDLRFVGTGQTTRLRGGLMASTVAMEHARPRDLVVLPGLGSATPDEVLARIRQTDAAQAIPWLVGADERGSDIAASCTAAFVLGAAGLLDGRRCATTWWLGKDLASLAPACIVDVDQMVVRDGRMWTAGSAFAHIDLLLALIRHFGGGSLSEELGRRLIVDERTSQAGFLIPSHLAVRDDLVAKLEEFVRTHVHQHHSLDSLAATCCTSTRTLDRRTRAAIGMSPMQLVQRVRLERALHLLRTTDMSLAAVAQAVGLTDPSALHRLVKRHTGQPPGRLRAS